MSELRDGAASSSVPPSGDAPPGEADSDVRPAERYELRRVVGEGGMGVVYEAFDRVRGSRVALKTMRRLDPSALYRFKNEFRALADVAHPNLVALHEFESRPERTFFTMEYVEGTDFVRHVAREAKAAGGFDDTMVEIDAEPRGARAADAVTDPPAGCACDLDRLRRAFPQLVEGIAALHAHGKLHRDVKPSNVLVTAEGRVVVLDFGLVASLRPDDAQSIEHNIVGTPAYMSPEQASAADLAEASDAYAIGVILYEALVGAPPFRGPPLKILLDKQRGEPPPPSAVVAGVPPDLDAICAALLRRDPRERPPLHDVLVRLGARPAEEHASRRGAAAPKTWSLDAAFVGRERHLGELAAAFTASREGRAVIAYVHGGSGMGKSLLVRRFLETIARDAVVLAGRCYERESVPYEALDTIVDALSRHLRQLTRGEVDAVLPLEIQALLRVFPVLERVEAVSAAPRRARPIPDPHEVRRRAASALREMLDRLSVRRPIVVWIDDLQWGDIDSAPIIHELFRQPDAPPLLFLASYRSEDASSALIAALREVHARNRGAVDVREIEVGPLDPTEARELALALLRRDDASARAQAAIVAAESRGSPFFIDELVQHLDAGDAIAWSPAKTDLRLDDVLHARVAALPADARRLLAVIAVAGKPVASAVAAAAADLAGDGESSAFNLLRAARFVRSVRSPRAQERHDVETYHDRIRETVAGRLEPEERARIHLRLARSLVADGHADPEALMVHFQEGGDQRRAAELAATAAAKAVEALAFDRAASLWARALELPDMTTETRRALQRKRGEALANAGRGVEAAEAYLVAADGASASDQLELRRRAAEQLLHSGRIDEGMRAIRDVLAAVGLSMPSSSWLILLTVVLLQLRIRLRGLAFRQRDASEISAKELTRVDICWSVGASLSIVRPMLSQVFRKRHLLLALDAGEPTRVTRGIAIEATTSAMSGVPARARTEELAREAQRLADQLHDPYGLAWGPAARGISAYLEGSFRVAVTLCDDANARFRDRYHGADWELANLNLFACQALFHLGEITELSRRMSALAQDARERGDRYQLTNVRIGWVNAAWLAADDPDRATSEIDEAMAEWGSPEQQLQQYYELVARAQIAMYVGRPREGLELVNARWAGLRRAHLLRVQNVRVFLWHVRARVAVASADRPGADARRLEQSARADAARIAREGLAWATPYARLVDAALASRRGDARRAIALLTRAADGFDACDMTLWAAAARRRQGELLGGDEGRALVDAADARMRAQSVRVPARFVAMLAPGFAPPAG